ncbi:methyltransferase domain-containing protein [Clostridia bacterium]|nr:methyltransferase domain-containing protein [Clostridia bacterium]
MFKWNEKSLQWMQQAASYSEYYQKIAQPIIDLLDQDSNICEIACGCGHLSMTLSSHVQHITAIDINPKVISFLKDELVSNNIRNIEPVVANWLPYTENKQFDVVLFSHFSALEEQLEKLMRVAKKYIIAIVPEKNNHTISPQLYTKKNLDYSRKEIMESAPDILKDLNIPFTQIFQANEFGQPLRDRRDAYEYIEHYYKISDPEDIEQFLNSKLQKLHCGYYLPKTKKTRTIIIDVQKASANVFYQ